MDTELRKVRALSTLRMYEGCCASVAARTEYLRECVEAAGIDMAAWRSLPYADHYPWPKGTREYVIRQGARKLNR